VGPTLFVIAVMLRPTMPADASMYKVEGDWEDKTCARICGKNSRSKVRRGAAYVAWEAELGPGVSMRTK